jgi:uncharacterized protein YkwD
MLRRRSALALRSLFFPLLLALAGCGVGGIDAIDDALGNGGGNGGSPAATMSASERTLAEQVLALVNEERATNGLAPVSWNEAAASAAYDHAVDMDVRNFFAHDNPDGESPGTRLAQAGVGGRGWAENIARGQADPISVMDAWMNSPGHRTNILNPAYRYLGVGVHTGVDGPWWVQDFLTP